MDSTNTRKNLRAIIEEKRLIRSGRHVKEKALDKTFKDLGLDREKFQQDLETVKKAGINLDAPTI